VFRFDQSTRESERENTHAGHAIHGTTPGTKRGFCDSRHRCQYQSMIPIGSFDSEFPGAFEKDLVDLTLGRPAESVDHLLVVWHQSIAQAQHRALV
jgi:hypothetical protein